MEVNEIITAIFQYGGTVIMAGLFIWVFIQDKTKNTKQLEEQSKMLETLAKSNDNIAKSLDLISNNLVTIDHKADRNYEQALKNSKD